MARMKRLLAFLLVLIMIFSIGQSAVLASDAVGDGTEADDGVVSTDPTPAPTPEATQVPEPTAEPEPTEEPEATPEPTQEPEVTPEPTAEPEVTPEPTAEPEVTPEPTAEPEQSPEPSIEPSVSPEPTEEPGPKQWPWTAPGNDIAVLMDGGWSLTSGGVRYVSENGVWKDAGGSVTQLSSTPADSLNLVDGWIYFSCGTDIRRVSASGGGEEVVFTAPASVAQMYVMGQEIRFLADGSVYSYDMNDGALEQLETPGTVKKFMPTSYGNLFLTGKILSYTLWAGEYQLMDGIEGCYPEGDWLIINKGDNTWQTAISSLFQGQLNLQDYSLNQVSTISALSDEAELASEQAYLESAEYAALEAKLTEPVWGSSGVMSISSRSAVQTEPLTTNQERIVQRSKQHSEVLWTPKIWRYTWGGDDPSYNTTGKTTVYDYKGGNKSTDRYLANVTYRGVPYSQPVYTGYVDWGKVTLQTFLDAVNNKNSNFYKSYSTYSRTAPYYGSDCSGFVSYTWDTPAKCTCTSLQNYAKKVTYKSPATLQVGDALNDPSRHVVLVTDIGYDSNGNVVAVEITEQTPPKMRVTQFVKDGLTSNLIPNSRYDRYLPLKNLEGSYINDGYSINRRNLSSTVKKPTDVAGLNALVAPTMTVKALGPSSVQIALAHEKSDAKIYYTTDDSKGVEFTDSFLYKGPIVISSAKGDVTVRAIAKSGDQQSTPLNETLPLSAAPRLDVASGKVKGTIFQYNNVSYVSKSIGAVTLVAEAGDTVYYTTNGSEPTTSSDHMESGKGSITVAADKQTVIKAFTVTANGVPSGVQSYTVQAADMYTITVNDPYGVLQPAAGLTVKDGKISVLSGSDVSFTISNTKGYDISAIKVDGKDIGAKQTSYKFPSVSADHTIAVILNTPFKDVAESAWYAGAAGYAYANKLISGTNYGNGTVKFDADMNTTRSMFVTILGRYANASVTYWTKPKTSATIAAENITPKNRMGMSNGSEINVRPKASLSSTPILTTIEAAGIIVNVVDYQDVDGVRWYKVNYNGQKGFVRRTNPSNNKLLLDVCEFTDLEDSDVYYSYGYVQWAYLNGIINGKSETLFGSRNTITREDLCVILYNYLTEVRGVVLSAPDISSKFPDAGTVSEYAKTAVSALVNIGVINGYDDGKLYPKASANRAVVATIFMNLDKYLNG